MGERQATITRTTKETDVTVSINLDGSGVTDIQTGVAFFDHMLDAFARHGLFDLTVSAKGDIDVDAHHTVEDVGIVIGCAIVEALGDKRGINRYGCQCIPMDEALVLASVDISGRGQLHYTANLPFGCLGEEFDIQLVSEFFIALADNAKITLHIIEIDGENVHHVVEAMFKSCGRALCEAVTINSRIGDAIPSTKDAL